MTDTLKKLLSFNATSGDEDSVREFIISEIKKYAKVTVDNLGNIIAYKKGKKTPDKKIMLDAHMDEVGLIMKSVTSDGYLKFETVGGIDTSVLLARRVIINDSVYGLIGLKPVHLMTDEERKHLPKIQNLYIDIGAKSRKEAEEYVAVGDRAVIESECFVNGDKIVSKALDDRIGCAVLIDLIKTFDEYDFYAVFSVQEEVGLRGAKVAAFSVKPDFAIVLEGTTAADIADVTFENTVCSLGKGPAVSFMDKSCVYDRKLYDAAINSKIMCQQKRAVAGGNNSGTIHLSGKGVRTLAVSVPCRYIHSAYSIADINDIKNAKSLAEFMIKEIAEGKV